MTSVVIDKERNTFKVLLGDTGEFSLSDVKKAQVLYENAKFYKKSPPFSHTILLSSLEPLMISIKNVYVGLEITLKDNKKIYAYISEHKQQQFSDEFNKEKKEAENIKEMLTSKR